LAGGGYEGCHSCNPESAAIRPISQRQISILYRRLQRLLVEFVHTFYFGWMVHDSKLGA
jgi:hypothetical protein